MKKTGVLIILLSLSIPLFAQRYMTRTAQIVFDASTPLENIHGVNNEGAAIIDLSTGDLVVQVLIRSFHLAKALMQEHFNEDYLESRQYPKAEFKGKIVNISDINLQAEGTYRVEVKGQLRIHGISRTINVPGTISIHQGKLSVRATFSINPDDYGIDIPTLVRNKIANEVQLSVRGRLHKI